MYVSIGLSLLLVPSVMACTNLSEKSNPSQKFEIEEIVETDLPLSYENPQYKNNNNIKKDDNRDNNGNTEGNNNSDSEDNHMNNGGKRKSSASTRVWRNPLGRSSGFRITTRKDQKSSSSKKKDKKKDTGGKSSKSNLSHDNHQFFQTINTVESDFDAHLPNSLSRDQFKQSSIFKEFYTSFQGLSDSEKKCLSSFILFPENTEVKKTLLLYWWIGEGFLDSVSKTDNGKALDDIVTDILYGFVAKRFILPINKRRKMVVNSFKMLPHVRSAMAVLAKEANESVDGCSTSAGNTFSWLNDTANLKNSGSLEVANQENIKTLFNVNNGFLDFSLEWFSKMRSVKVVYIGRWQNSTEHHHIEVLGTEFLKGLKNMEDLRFLSLQGITGIQELPSSISNARDLKVLDLRACYNLEKLPQELDALKKLTHLDISECYLLDCMPKELLSLSELQVLKGFVIADAKNRISCTLAELAGLKKLRKLSVNVNSETLSIEEFSAIFKFKELLKLKIAWGGKFSKFKPKKRSCSKQENSEAKSKATTLEKSKARKLDTNKRSFKRQESAVGRVTKLQKIELQCLPHKTLPNWLNPENLSSLEKLYIRGGGLKSLCRIQEKNPILEAWKVKAIRLKYLRELKMNWRELKVMFPQLKFLEKFRCPMVTLCPCDCTGVWVKSLNKESTH